MNSMRVNALLAITLPVLAVTAVMTSAAFAEEAANVLKEATAALRWTDERPWQGRKPTKATFIAWATAALRVRTGP